MIDGPLLIGLALAYVGALFLVAWTGDRMQARRSGGSGRPLVYALSIGVYCTSWTFFGSVGLAASSGIDFIPVYTGAVICFLFCTPLIRRIVRLAKHQNLTSVADFLAARYGKSQTVAAVVTVIAVVSALPYVALQLKAVAFSVETVLGARAMSALSPPVDTALIVAAGMALFAILFGTRHADATEHQHGLILAIAAESLVKLAAFLAVGTFVVVTAFGASATQPNRVLEMLARSPAVIKAFDHPFNAPFWLTVTLLSFFAVLLLPRQFHVAVVENNSEADIRRASWLFPLYLLLINVFVIPIALAGLANLPPGLYQRDTFVLALPLEAGSRVFTLIAFVGGLSAATAMVIVNSVALALMVCNGLVAPVLLRSRFNVAGDQQDMVGWLLAIRRAAIVGIIFLGYCFYRLLDRNDELASIGLVAFAGVAQLGPAFLIGLVWRKATALGALSGMVTGFCVWMYTLVLPWFADAHLIDAHILTDGPWGIGLLAPQSLLHVRADPLTHGVFWSLAANIFAFTAMSLVRSPEPVERLQAQLFVANELRRPAVQPVFRRWRTSLTAADLEATAASYLGKERAAREFACYAESHPNRDHSAPADVELVQFTERLLTSAIGAASARLVLSLLLRRGTMAPGSALQLLDDASEALQHNRDLLQSALDQVRHGLSVFDRDLRLVCWNRQFRELLDLPADMGHFGMPLADVLRLCASRGDFGPGRVEDLVADRLLKLAVKQETFVEPFRGGRRILEIRTVAMTQGGIVTTYADITERVADAEALERANETLERRVAERTAELSRANTALGAAKVHAEAANIDKTRFLAAASHDILQPLNAARLYASSLIEQPIGAASHAIAGKIDQSLNAVEEILGALIEIARLDTGRMEADVIALPVQEIFERLRVEFEPLARERGLSLTIVPSSLWVRSDRRLLPRLMQNLVSNALKYTNTGGVLVGARRVAEGVALQVVDTGPGIAPDRLAIIFKEFQRLPETAASVSGLGLGLSIVERVAKVLDHHVNVVSRVGRGSMFAVTLPRAAPGAVAAAVPEAAGIAADTRLGGLSVLCIDNDQVVLEGMRTLLEGWGCRVVAAPGAPEALEAAAGGAGEPDVILADYHLDRGSGLDAIEAVRAHFGRPIAALVITADSTAELHRQVREAGLGVLRKPVKVAALRAALLQARLRAARSVAAE